MLLAFSAVHLIDQPARDLCADVRDALRLSGWKQQAAAATMHVPETKLSEQLNGHTPFTFLWRCTALGASFWTALLEVRGARFGLEVVGSPDLVRLIHSVERIERAMLRAELPAPEQKARVS